MSEADTPVEAAPLGFNEHQKEYLAGFGAGLAAAQALPVVGTQSAAPAQELWFNTPLDEVTREERLKIERDPFAIWDQMVAAAASNTPPKDGDVFRYKYHGLFWVAPAQDSFMVRIKVPGNVLRSSQALTLAKMSEDLSNAYADVTTRGNIQLRNIAPSGSVEVLQRLAECGLSSRGAGADNVRNVTASPLAGLDLTELIDTRPLARQMQFYLNNHAELFGLPRKFNIAFDGGGCISNVSDTNDIAFIATRSVKASANSDVLMRVLLAGITGHERFAMDVGVAIEPERAVAVAGAMLKVFRDHGDRTDRSKARLCYLLDRIGVAAFLRLTEEHLGWSLPRHSAESLLPRPKVARRAHLGVHTQNHAGLLYVGIVVTAGRLTAGQLRCAALAAERFGSAELRLTVWQNILIPSVDKSHLPALIEFLAAEGLSCNAERVSGSMVACTGNTGCRFAESDTKGHARLIASQIDEHYQFDDAVNIHLTGCPHSCAQHYIGDIGFLGAQMPLLEGVPRIEGYHLYVGGGCDDQMALAREIARNVPATSLPKVVRGLLDAYRDDKSEGESFFSFTQRQSVEQLKAATGLDAQTV